MEKELETLKTNNTWELVPCPKEVKPLETRWVYKIKKDNNDFIYKSRYVAKGFEQIYGLNYLETFASVIKQMAWKLVFAIAALYNLIIYKIDMISAFTQGDVDSIIYIKQPEGFINSKYPNHVLKLNKALYGLKQSARVWYSTLKPILIKLSFKVLDSKPCIFINKCKNIIICLYVDDLAVLAPNIKVFNNFAKDIKKYFKITNLKEIKDYLRVNIKQTKDYININQNDYINKMLNKFELNNIYIKNTPMDSNIKLDPNLNKASQSDITKFQRLIGSLLYLMLCTRPDIAFPVIKLARFANNPSNIHFKAVYRVFAYLKGTINLGITYYKKGNKFITGFCDSDYAGDFITAKSTSGFIFLLACGVISWKSKLQSIIAQSSTEAEYISLSLAAKEAIFLKTLLEELGFYNQIKLPIYCDNNGAIELANNPKFHERTKHIAVKYHFIRDLINKNIIELIYINTSDQKADGLTKALDRVKFNKFLNLINLKDSFN